jgi:hypothetical protein
MARTPLARLFNIPIRKKVVVIIVPVASVDKGAEEGGHWGP